jgi:hypothetical protein
LGGSAAHRPVSFVGLEMPSGHDAPAAMANSGSGSVGEGKSGCRASKHGPRATRRGLVDDGGQLKAGIAAWPRIIVAGVHGQSRGGVG